MKLRILIDTSVLVAALYNPGGRSSRLVDALLFGKHTVVYSEALLREVRSSAATLGISKRLVNAQTRLIRRRGLKVSRPKRRAGYSEDPKDDYLFALALSEPPCDVLISADKKHVLGVRVPGLRLLSIAQACRQFGVK